ncbi:aldolase/citrate lyase family protein [Nocardia sp. CA-290969]|uniref:aldolase/citrate lyase family protein n=1 Tax=Nocardia sp. CA-290969 TaxID=3239986 RepID=UPI003D8F256A
MTAQHTTRRVEATIARSWLLVNVAEPGAVDRAVQCAADQIVLDIEDAVDPTRKPAARAEVAHWLATFDEVVTACQGGGGGRRPSAKPSPAGPGYSGVPLSGRY